MYPFNASTEKSVCDYLYTVHPLMCWNDITFDLPALADQLA